MIYKHRCYANFKRMAMQSELTKMIKMATEMHFESMYNIHGIKYIYIYYIMLSRLDERTAQ